MERLWKGQQMINRDSTAVTGLSRRELIQKSAVMAALAAFSHVRIGE